MADKYQSPDYPIGNPGKTTMQAMGEAMARQEAHDCWHRDHPGEYNCPPELSPPGDYEAIERGQNLMGAMTFEAGDSFARRK